MRRRSQKNCATLGWNIRKEERGPLQNQSESVREYVCTRSKSGEAALPENGSSTPHTCDADTYYRICACMYGSMVRACMCSMCVYVFVYMHANTIRYKLTQLLDVENPRARVYFRSDCGRWLTGWPAGGRRGSRGVGQRMACTNK